MTTHYELRITPHYPWPITLVTYECIIGQIKARAMNKACSPYPVEDEFGRVYTAFGSYRLALDAAVQVRLAYDCTIEIYPFQAEGDIHPKYALVPLQVGQEVRGAV